MPWWGWVLVGLGVLIVAFIVFALTYGKKLQRKQAEAEKQMAAVKQDIPMLIIDKQKKKAKESGLPESVLSQMPKLSRNLKLPVVKAKIGPKIMTLIAEEKVFEILPVKKEVTVSVSGIYITELKKVRGGTVPKLPEKKKTLFTKLSEKAKAAQMK